MIIEPFGMFAEVYRLYNGHYRLEGEFKAGEYHFELEECNFFSLFLTCLLICKININKFN